MNMQFLADTIFINFIFCCYTSTVIASSSGSRVHVYTLLQVNRFLDSCIVLSSGHQMWCNISLTEQFYLH